MALENVGENLSPHAPETRSGKVCASPWEVPFHASRSGNRKPSPHAFGIAVNRNPAMGAYWHWAKQAPDVHKIRKSLAPKIVAAFEKHGFIWVANDAITISCFLDTA